MFESGGKEPVTSIAAPSAKVVPLTRMMKGTLAAASALAGPVMLMNACCEICPLVKRIATELPGGEAVRVGIVVPEKVRVEDVARVHPSPSSDPTTEGERYV